MKLFQLSGTVAIVIYAIAFSLLAMHVISWSYMHWFWFKCGLLALALVGVSLGFVDRRRNLLIVGINVFIALLLFVDVALHALYV